MDYLPAKAELTKPAARPSFFNLAIEAVVMVMAAQLLLVLFGN